MRRIYVVVVLAIQVMAVPAASAGKVLRVGTYRGVKGQYKTIQAAVNAAKPGDWVLVAPGDYKTNSGKLVTGSNGEKFPAGVLITTPHLRLRGMNRNRVIVDGTRRGPPCSRAKADQNLGPAAASGALGLNGVMIWKADDVWVQNLTACNFLNGKGASGNEIWWNGGADSGGATTVSIGGWGYRGDYLNATSTFYENETTAAAYGIFTSNWSGGTWDHSYASNFNDSGYYIGACGAQCNQTVNHAWAEFNALGYSGSNSGGWMLIENSQFDNNETGFSTNTQNGDNPPPQDGACPNAVKPPVPSAPTCWVFTHNYVHDNNNPNVPTAGSAAAGPVGTGVSISGGRDDTLTENRITGNKAWGVIFVPYPDFGPPCTGGVGGTQAGAPCTYDDWGNALLNNTFSHNGGYGNQTNGDFGEVTFFPGHPINCYRGNRDTSGPLTSSPSNLQQTNASCGHTATTPDSNAPFTNQVVCDSQIYAPLAATPCVGGSYPRRTQVLMPPLPPASQLPSMPNPCAGVPTNPWCPARRVTRRRHRAKKRPAHFKPLVVEARDGQGFWG